MGATSVDSANKELTNLANSSGTSQITATAIAADNSQNEGSSEKQDASAATTAPGPSIDPWGQRTQSEISKWRFITLSTALSLGFLLAIMDTSIVATSLYAIAKDFGEIESINWVALAYTLSYLSCAVLFARISDVIGRREAYMLAYVIFVAFSLACAWSQNLTQLIAFRAIQGVGGSGLYSLSMILMPEVAPLKYQKFMIGFIGIVLAVAGVLGPLLGGVLTEHSTWRWVFWINGPIGGVSAVLFWWCWPRPEFLPPFDHRKWKDVDFLGSLLLVATAVLIVFPLQHSSAEPNSWSTAIFIAPLVIGVACLGGLFAYQWYIDREADRKWNTDLAAAIPMVLIRNRVYMCAVLNTTLMGFPYLLSLYAFPIRFQIVNGKGPLDAGLMLLPMLGATALGSFLAGVINGKKNVIAETLVIAAALMLLGCALQTTAGSGVEVEAKVLGFQAFMGFGFGLSATCSTMVASLQSPIREHASAQGILAQVRILGGSIGIAASSMILGAKLASLGGGVDLNRLTHSELGMAELTPEQQTTVRIVYTAALRDSMIVCAALMGLAMVCGVGTYTKDRLSVVEQQQKRVTQEIARRSTPMPPKPMGEA
ncbi:hypothetical protein OQA88_2796 [Cercophora sp. LCS_1]